MDESFAVVVGAGVMGLATAYELSRQGKSVIVIDRGALFNEQGSSGGLSRMWRVIYSQRYLCEFALRADPMWRELEKAAGKNLIDRTGSLWYGQPTTSTTEGQIEAAIKVMDDLGLKYDKLTASDIERKYSFANVNPSHVGVFQENAGTIHVPETLRVLRSLCHPKRVKFYDHLDVISIESDSGGVTVRARRNDSKSTPAEESFRAEKLVLCPGPFVNDVLALLGFGLDVEIWEMASAYFKLADGKPNPPMWFLFQEATPGDPGLYYGFPAAPWERPGYARVAPDFASRILTSPRYRSHAPHIGDISATANFVRRYMPSLHPEPAFGSTCLITMTKDPNQDPVLGLAPNFVPNHERTAVYVGGWGFKFAPLIGKILAELSINGKTTEDISRFAIDRPGILTAEAQFRWHIKNGIPKAAARETIAIAGAGMAGLVSGSLLQAAGYDVVIVESRDEVGGRIRTLRQPFHQSEGGPLQYGEAGAMRIPTFHRLVQDYITAFSLPTNPFLEIDRDGRSLYYVNGVRATRQEYISNPDILGYPVGPSEIGMSADALLDRAIRPIVDFVAADPAQNWPVIVDRFDKYSVRGFLKEHTLYSEAAIEMIGVLLDEEALMSTSFIESIRDQADINANNSYVEITGGMDRLPKAFLPQLGGCIRFGHRLLNVVQHPDGNVELTTSGGSILASRVIITLPFSAVRHVRFEPPLSHNKAKAIRELHYDSSAKVLLQFKRRFWEQDEGIFGGGTITDLPIRFAFYPSHCLGGEGSAVMLASYTWSDDSARWDSLSEQARVEAALRDLAVIHGEVVHKEFLQGTSQSWLRDDHSLGAFALFHPGQQAELYADIIAPERHVFFAGEHTTLKHAWIEGAIESGIRAAIQVRNSLPSTLSKYRAMPMPQLMSADSSYGKAMVNVRAVSRSLGPHPQARRRRQ